MKSKKISTFFFCSLFACFLNSLSECSLRRPPLTVSGGGIGTTSLTAFTLLVSGTTSTSSLQSFPSGTAGQLLQSAGPGALPVWVDAVTKTITFTLTSEQIKNLRAYPITLLEAPGEGKIIEVFRGNVKFNYGGNNPFIADAGQTIRLSRGDMNGLPIMQVASTELITATANKIMGVFNAGQSLSNDFDIVNQPVVLFNTSEIEISGNAANDNSLTFVLIYQIFEF